MFSDSEKLAMIAMVIDEAYRRGRDDAAGGIDDRPHPTSDTAFRGAVERMAMLFLGREVSQEEVERLMP